MTKNHLAVWASATKLHLRR